MISTGVLRSFSEPNLSVCVITRKVGFLVSDFAETIYFPNRIGFEITVEALGIIDTELRFWVR